MLYMQRPGSYQCKIVEKVIFATIAYCYKYLTSHQSRFFVIRKVCDLSNALTKLVLDYAMQNFGSLM